jgi:hypothetical protein
LTIEESIFGNTIPMTFEDTIFGTIPINEPIGSSIFERPLTNSLNDPEMARINRYVSQELPSIPINYEPIKSQPLKLLAALAEIETENPPQFTNINPHILEGANMLIKMKNDIGKKIKRKKVKSNRRSNRRLNRRSNQRSTQKSKRTKRR